MMATHLPSSPPEKGALAYRDNFAAIRLVAAMLVIFGHAFPLTGGQGPSYLGSAISTLAVKVFFVISGYLITGSWTRDPNIGRYLIRRILRIIPALLVLCVLTIFIVGALLTTLPLGEYFKASGTWNYLTNVILLPNYALPGVFAGNVYPGAVNGSLWTLPVEFLMYLLLPLVFLLPLSRFSILAVAVMSSLASVWLTRIQVPAQPLVIWGTDLIHVIGMAPYFFWGAAYKIWVPKEHLNIQWSVMLMVLLPLLGTGWVSAEVVALLLVPYLTLSLGHVTPPAFGWIERYGDPSYGIYLYGFLCQQVVAHFLPWRDAPYLNFVFSIVPAVFLGMLSWRFIEEPMLKLKPLRSRNKR